MKIAIQHTKGSFSDRWIEYCRGNNIEYKLVDCYKTNILNQLSDCNALMWHFHHEQFKDYLFAKQLLTTLHILGMRIFPDFNSYWHFDDKIAQKYLFEALSIPTVPTNVFYNKNDALDWASKTDYPKVFKLRKGSASKNVRLIKNYKEAKKIIIKSFYSGHPVFNKWSNLNERIRRFRDGLDSWTGIIKGVGRLIIKTQISKNFPKEKGYVYFQDFIADNDYDIRVIVIGNKAFAIKRMVRDNDFRASGSGFILYTKEHFDEDTIRLAFETSEKLQGQCISCDFVYKDGNPLIVEISYGFVKNVYDQCVGYWDRDMRWHEGSFNPYGWMVDLVKNNSYIQ